MEKLTLLHLVCLGSRCPFANKPAHEQKSRVLTRSFFIEQSVDNLSSQHICLHVTEKVVIVAQLFDHTQHEWHCPHLAR